MEDVTVIDGSDAAPKPHQSILIAGDRIVAIAPPARLRVPPGVVVRLHGSGKWAIPGLWDMHTHALRPERHDFFLRLMIANGVVGTRDMGAGTLALRDEWRREIASGRRAGPRIVATGPVLDGPLPMLPGSYTASTGEEAARAVAASRASGADFVKVYSLLPEDALRGAVAEARRLGIPLVGHLSEYIPAAAASDMGQRSFEHLLGVLVSISSREDALRARIVAATTSGDRAVFAQTRRAAYGEAARSIDTVKARRIFARLARNRTWQTPTFTYWRGLLHDFDMPSPADSVLRFMPDAVTDLWRNQAMAFKASRVDLAVILGAFQWMAREMRRAGAPFLAGTDALGVWCAPGFALHDELAEFVAVGFTPLEAIQAASRNAAEFLGASDSLGTITAGKVADLVLLDADPLADIHNTRRISTVIAAGRVYDRRALTTLLTGELDQRRTAPHKPPESGATPLLEPVEARLRRSVGARKSGYASQVLR